jgi:exopolysaccharide biosynthesis predicted pyruvyltransferase EpsI
MHLELMQLAKLIAIRSDVNLDKILKINSNTIVIPDIVFSLSEKNLVTKKPNSILIIPNIAVVPKQQDEHWKHAAWEFFKSEFSQFLNELVKAKYSVDFLSMCNNKECSDSWAAIEIINRMDVRKTKYLLPSTQGIENLSKLISSYEIVITQRFHGIILSEMVKTPYLAIYHHDKLKPTSNLSGEFISFYSLNKNLLLDKIKNTFDLNFKESLPIERNIFDKLNQLVLDILSSE